MLVAGPVSDAANRNVALKRPMQLPVSYNPTNASAVVSCAYWSALGREAEAGGSQNWSSYYARTGYNAANLMHGINTSLESQRRAMPIDQFVTNLYLHCLYRTPSASEVAYWVGQHRSAGTSREAMFEYFVFNGDRTAPVYERCKQFKPKSASSVTPLCVSGSGSSSEVATVAIPGSNIVTNIAWAKSIEELRHDALQAGFDLQATPSSSPWPTAGSFRSAAAQQWMRDHGYPAAKGTSNHEWGLAIDFRCNGRAIGGYSACLNWMKKNAAHYGVYNKIMSKEPWHWSSNGY